MKTPNHPTPEGAELGAPMYGDWEAMLEISACDLESNQTGDDLAWFSALGNPRAATRLAFARDIRSALAEITALRGQLADERMEHGLLKELLSRPEIDEFYDGVVLEAAHQRQRWGDAHDRSKSAENWFWLVGYLSGKALRSAIEGDQNKARHHTISSGAALFQWWKAIKESTNGVGVDADLNPENPPADQERVEP